MYSLKEFMRHKRSVDWLVDGVIQTESRAMLFGESGIGKSFAAIDMALCVASGRDWHGRAVRQGSVAYMATEGSDGLQSRVLAWARHHGMSQEEIEALPLYIAPKPFELTDSDERFEFIDELEKIRPLPKLTIIDTLTGAAHGLDQNSAKDMAAFAYDCEIISMATSGTVLLVHHSGHKEKGRSKGAVDLHAACDTVAGMMRVQRSDVLAIKSAKSRNSKPFDDIYLQLEDCGPSAVLVDAKKPQKANKPKLSRGDTILREVLDDGPLSEADARERFDEAYGGTAGAKRNAWARAIGKSEKDGFIEVDESGLLSVRTPATQNQ